MVMFNNYFMVGYMCILHAVSTHLPFPVCVSVCVRSALNIPSTIGLLYTNLLVPEWRLDTKSFGMDLHCGSSYQAQCPQLFLNAPPPDQNASCMILG
uniref:Secreted protein n=1 Tax=Pyxicephalus adspersus TaxID=30357 RepID=A0AAV3ABY0_PYXAD|nr:TPA: hypothetical protein GDO54_013524 [Pyxicephalus adspersus]